MKLLCSITTVAAVCLCAGCANHHEVAKVGDEMPYGYSLISPGAKFGALPPPAQNAVRAEVGAAEIGDIVKTPTEGAPVYKIYFRNFELYPPLYVDANGNVLYPDREVAMGASRDPFGTLTGSAVSSLRPDEVPAAVTKTIQQRAPGIGIAHISKQTWGDRVVFIITFVDETHHPRLYVAADGTILNEGPK